MAYEMRDGQGTIFKNKYHEDGDNKPPYKGAVMWRGEKIEIALWVNDGQQGKFFSVKMQEPRDAVGQPSPASMTPHVPPPSERAGARAMPKRADMDDSEIPF